MSKRVLVLCIFFSFVHTLEYNARIIEISMATPQESTSEAAARSERPILLTLIAVFGIVFAVLLSIATAYSLYQVVIELSKQFPGVSIRSIIRMLALSRFGLLTLVLVAAISLRFATPIGLLYMRRWAYKCFMIIVGISLLLFLYAISYKPAISVQAAGVFFVEAAILYYLYRIRARLH